MQILLATMDTEIVGDVPLQSVLAPIQLTKSEWVPGVAVAIRVTGVPCMSVQTMSSPTLAQLAPLALTLPRPFPAIFSFRVWLSRSNLPMHALSLSMNTSPSPHSATTPGSVPPVQPAKTEWPSSNTSTGAQVPQSYASSPTKKPDPAPAGSISSVRLTLSRVKVAVHDLEVSILTEPVAHSRASGPLQPNKNEPGSGVAVRVTTVLLG